MAPKNFRSKLEDNFIALPFDVRKLFGRARPAVKMSINGFSYRSTVSVYDGRYFILCGSPIRRPRESKQAIPCAQLSNWTKNPGPSIRRSI